MGFVQYYHPSCLPYRKLFGVLTHDWELGLLRVSARLFGIVNLPPRVLREMFLFKMLALITVLFQASIFPAPGTVCVIFLSGGLTKRTRSAWWKLSVDAKSGNTFLL